MRAKRRIIASDIPFYAVYWNGGKFYVGEMETAGWEFTLSTQIGKSLSENDYYYFREPKSKMILRVTRKRKEKTLYGYTATADFMTLEKNVASIWRAFQSQEAILRAREELSEPIVFNTEGKRVVEKVYNDKTDQEHWNDHLNSIEYLTEEGREYVVSNLIKNYSISQLLDMVLNKLPKLTRRKKFKLPDNIINFEEYLNKFLAEEAA